MLRDLENDRPSGANHRSGGAVSSVPRDLAPPQLTFFGKTSPVLEELLETDIESLTPLEALNKIYELQRKAKEDPLQPFP